MHRSMTVSSLRASFGRVTLSYSKIWCAKEVVFYARGMSAFFTLTLPLLSPLCLLLGQVSAPAGEQPTGRSHQLDAKRQQGVAMALRNRSSPFYLTQYSERALVIWSISQMIGDPTLLWLKWTPNKWAAFAVVFAMTMLLAAVSLLLKYCALNTVLLSTRRAASVPAWTSRSLDYGRCDCPGYPHSHTSVPCCVAPTG